MLLPALLLVVAANLHDVIAKSSNRVSDMPIHFPGPVKGYTHIHSEEEIAEECRDKTYCTIKPQNYPEERFDKMFKGVKTIPEPRLVMGSLLSNRQGDPDERDDCDTEVEYKPLYTVRSKRDGEWRTVVQTSTEDYVQKVRLETCTNPGGACFNAFPPTSDFNVFCKQKTNKWEVLVAKGNNETEKIEVELPVCCVCQYKPASIESRFGVPKAVTPAKKNLADTPMNKTRNTSKSKV